MAEEMPTYIPGDVIRLDMQIEHEINVIDVWANFARREEGSGRSFTFGIHLQELRLREWRGISRISDVVLEYEVKRREPLEGVYDLDSVLGLHYGAPQREERYVSAFDAPSDVSFRITAPSATSTPRVESLELSLRPPS